MQGFEGNLFKSKFYYEQAMKLFQIFKRNQNNQLLINGLSEYKMIIEKLLQNQIYLTFYFQNSRGIQTTDSQNNGDNRSIIEQFSRENIFQRENLVLQQNVIVQKQNSRKITSSIRSLESQLNHKRKLIEIVSINPYYKNLKFNNQFNIKQQKQVQKNEKSISKQCQTKNTIKNFGKCILTFIRKEKCLMDRICKHYGVEKQKFDESIKQFKCKLYSRNDLKRFFTEEGSQFSDIIRVVSNIYLKKYSLQHTFRSRVRKISTHIKYRQRFLEILKNPEYFESIKYK